MIKSIIYDLDNTLYDESAYFKGAYKTIAEYISKKSGVGKQEVCEKLLSVYSFKGSLYPFVFNDVLDSWMVTYNGEYIKTLVNHFHNHDPNIVLYDDVLPAFKELKKRSIKLGLLTNGKGTTQRRKVKRLNLNKVFDAMVFPYELEREKPDPFPFIKILQELKVKSNEAIYVGDNPHIDFPGARKVGLYTVRIIRGEFRNHKALDCIDASFKINSHLEIFQVMELINGQILR